MRTGHIFVMSCLLLFGSSLFPGILMAEGVLFGQVTSQRDGESLEDVVVKVMHVETQQFYFSQPTDSQGNYELSGLPDGYYQIGVSTRNGDFLFTDVVQLDQTADNQFKGYSDDSDAGPIIKSPPSNKDQKGTMSFRVFDLKDDSPVDGARLLLKNKGTGEEFKSTKTDKEGCCFAEKRLKGVSPGDYEVIVQIGDREFPFRGIIPAYNQPRPFLAQVCLGIDREKYEAVLVQREDCQCDPNKNLVLPWWWACQLAIGVDMDRKQKADKNEEKEKEKGLVSFRLFNYEDKEALQGAKVILRNRQSDEIFISDKSNDDGCCVVGKHLEDIPVGEYDVVIKYKRKRYPFEGILNARDLTGTYLASMCLAIVDADQSAVPMQLDDSCVRVLNAEVKTAIIGGRVLWQNVRTADIYETPLTDIEGCSTVPRNFLPKGEYRVTVIHDDQSFVYEGTLQSVGEEGTYVPSTCLGLDRLQNKLVRLEREDCNCDCICDINRFLVLPWWNCPCGKLYLSGLSALAIGVVIWPDPEPASPSSP